MFGQLVEGLTCAESGVQLVDRRAVYAVTCEDTRLAFCVHPDVLKGIPQQERRYGDASPQVLRGLNIHRTVALEDGETFEVDDFVFSISTEVVTMYLPKIAEYFGIEDRVTT